MKIIIGKFLNSKIFKNKYIPASKWLTGYTLKLFGYDAISGITLAAYAIPVSMAYASLAGLPPQFGIYGYLIGGLFYAILGTSKQLAIGPTSAISLLVGTSLSTMANGNIQHWLDLTALTSIIFAILSIIFYIFKLSSIINFISETILLGFKAGAAITIGMTQLPKLFGVQGGGDNFFSRFITLTEQLDTTNYYVLAFGLSAIALIIIGEKLFPHKPVTIIVVILSIIIIALTPITNAGFKTVGIIPTGFPELRFPSFDFSDFNSVFPLAFACFLLAYIESVSSARTLAQKNNYEIDSRQELFALGFANLAVSFAGCYPVCGGLSQSAVNDKAGAKTPISLVMASASIAICLLFLTEYFKFLPTVILASIVLVAIKGLVDIKEFKRLQRINKFDFIIAITSVISVIVFGILQGVVIAAIASLVLMIKAVSNPHVAFLGRIPGTNRYSDFKRHPDNEQIPGVMIVRVESSLWYFNVSNIYHAIWTKVLESDSNLQMLVFDLSTSVNVDTSGTQFIKKLYYNLKELGIALKVVEAHADVRDILRLEEIEHLLGHVSRRDSVHDVITAFINEQNNKQ